MNIGAPWPDLDEAESRVLKMQTKLHQWASSDPGRRFDDLFNLVYDPAFLVVAWSRVRGNKGSRSAGVDGVAPFSILFGAGEFLDGLREDLKAQRFIPMMMAVMSSVPVQPRLPQPQPVRPTNIGASSTPKMRLRCSM